MLPSGTWNNAGGKPSGPDSGGKPNPVSGTSPRRRMVTSTGSPTDTTVRLACTSMANPPPMALANVGGLPATGSGRTVRRRGSPRAWNSW